MAKENSDPGDLTAGDHDEKPGMSIGAPKRIRRISIGGFRDRMLLVLFLFFAYCIASCNAGPKFMICISAVWDSYSPRSDDPLFNPS